MAMTALETKPIDAITAADVQAFVAPKAVAESQTLEFKQEAKPFALRRSIVALANAYGGVFVLGVVEDKHVAVGLKLVENCVDGANKIGQSIADAISPPLIGFRARGIPIQGDAGVVVLRVPASPRRPHATTSPDTKLALHVFVRRGLETKSVDMREVQDMTLAAAAQSKRVLDRLAEMQAPFLEHRRTQTAKTTHPYLIQVCAAPTTPIALARPARDASLRIDDIVFEAPIAGGLGRFPFIGGQWNAIFRGVETFARDDLFSRCRAAVHEDGSCLIEFGPLPPNPERDPEKQLYLSWYVGCAASIALWCEKIRKAADEPALEFALTWLIACDSDGVEMITDEKPKKRVGEMLQGLHRTPPAVLAEEGDVDRFLNAAVTDFFSLCGRAGPSKDVAFDLSGVRKEWGLADG